MRQTKTNTVTTTATPVRGAYTPQLSPQAVFLLRRLSWQQGKPMTQTLNALVLAAASQIQAGGFCATCKGTQEQCAFCPVKKA